MIRIENKRKFFYPDHPIILLFYLPRSPADCGDSDNYRVVVGFVAVWATDPFTDRVAAGTML
jgi:hypothetical protein